MRGNLVKYTFFKKNRYIPGKVVPLNELLGEVQLEEGGILGRRRRPPPLDSLPNSLI